MDLSNLRRKSRILVSQGLTQHLSGDPSNTWIDLPHGFGSGSLDSLQMTWSRDNTLLQRAGSADTGGPFYSRKFGITKYPSTILEDFKKLDDIVPRLTFYTYGTGGRRFTTPVLPVPTSLWAFKSFRPDGSDFSLPVSEESFLRNWGTKAIELSKPTRNANSLFVSLKEIHSDGLPSTPLATLWKERTRVAKGAGKEYLNSVFGWLPLINDIQKFANSANRFEQIWSQYERDAGRLVRRGFRPEPEQQQMTELIDYPYFGTTGPLADGISALYDPVVGIAPRKLTITTRSSRARWFSGAFRYYLPDRGSKEALKYFRRELSRLNHLLGIVPTPDNVWSATPWTWALDWVSNAGSVVSNLSDTLTDSLVMPYGYVCEHTTRTVELSSTGGTFRRNELISVPAPRLYIAERREVKQRIQASPYGFGLTWEGFSPTQLAILASLGITRGR